MNTDQPTPNKPNPTKVLIFSASLRKDSLNTKLSKLAIEIVEKNNGIVDYAHMSEFDSPSFNEDVETKGEIPAQAIQFRDRILANDAMIICSPEYNNSIPGLLKNAIDWASRFRPQPFKDHHALLMSASPSMVGGNRGLWTLRVPLENLGTHVFPSMFSLSMAHKAFTPEDKIADATLTKRFDDNIVAFLNSVEASKNYPCIKKAWVQFLGATPDPAFDREE